MDALIAEIDDLISKSGYWTSSELERVFDIIDSVAKLARRVTTLKERLNEL